MTPLRQRARDQWRQWRTAWDEAHGGAVTDGDWAAEGERVFEASEFVAQAACRNPSLLGELIASHALTTSYQPGEMSDRLLAELEGIADEQGLQRQLRRFRQCQMLRIIWRDISTRAALDETLEDLSALADATIDQALALLYAWETERQGTPRDKAGEVQQLVVLGMGKLGARELNLSSDIDLIFTFPAHGVTDGRRAVENQQFFTRLCQKLVKALGSQTVDGFVFRVDTRLRPFGDAGPLALSFDAMEEYYQSQAREWERYAMIKARVVGGDQAKGAELMAMLRPFVYRRYLDFGVIESLRKMKELIARELHRKGMDANIKLGPGGIREIEFIGQAFQLVRGGRDPDLQIRPIQQVLARLAKKGLMPDFAVNELTQAYRFLRLAENRIQAWRDEQSHLLPGDEEGRLRLARAMGYADWAAFVIDLEQHRRRVQGQFDQVFAAPQAGGEEEHAAPLLDLWQGKLSGEEGAATLAQLGFEDSDEVARQLEGFRTSHACRALGGRGRERMDELMPLILSASGATEQATVTLARVLGLLEAVARRTAYLALLVEHPIALSQLIRLAAASPWIIERLARQPILLDELLDPRRLYAPLRREALDQELEILLSAVAPEDVEHQMDRLRQFAHGNMLRVAAADITDVIPVMVVSDYLTWIAEAVLERVVDQAWRHLFAKHGAPSGVAEGSHGLAVIGYGKLGGIELGYGSDLDMVFVHGAPGGGATNGGREVADEVFYARFGQRIVHILTTRTAAGQLYEADMRLRPNGNSGMLVPSLDAFERYQSESAWTWEHQALVRARPVAGDARTIERFMKIRRQILAEKRDPQALRDQVREMREKMRVSLDKSKEGFFDLKQGAGGIADIEFMVQYAVLRWAFQHAELLEWSDNIRLLEVIGKLALFGEGVAEVLADAYRRFRDAYHHRVLQQRDGPAQAAEFAAARERVIGIWRQLMEAGSASGQQSE